MDNLRRGLFSSRSGDKRQQKGIANKLSESSKDPVRKWESFVPDFLREESIKEVEPVNSEKRKKRKAFFEKMIQDARDKGKEKDEKAWIMLRHQSELPDLDRQFQVEMLKEFHAWLQGKGKDEYHNKTPWGRSTECLNFPGVAAYLDQFTIVRHKVLQYLQILWVSGPKDLDDLWLIFKYLIYGNVEDIFKDDFIYEFHLWEKGFGITGNTPDDKDKLDADSENFKNNTEYYGPVHPNNFRENINPSQPFNDKAFRDTVNKASMLGLDEVYIPNYQEPEPIEDVGIVEVDEEEELVPRRGSEANKDKEQRAALQKQRDEELRIRREEQEKLRQKRKADQLSRQEEEKRKRDDIIEQKRLAREKEELAKKIEGRRQRKYSEFQQSLQSDDGGTGNRSKNYDDEIVWGLDKDENLVQKRLGDLVKKNDGSEKSPVPTAGAGPRVRQESVQTPPEEDIRRINEPSVDIPFQDGPAPDEIPAINEDYEREKSELEKRLSESEKEKELLKKTQQEERERVKKEIESFNKQVNEFVSKLQEDHAKALEEAKKANRDATIKDLADQNEKLAASEKEYRGKMNILKKQLHVKSKEITKLQANINQESQAKEQDYINKIQELTEKEGFASVELKKLHAKIADHNKAYAVTREAYDKVQSDLEQYKKQQDIDISEINRLTTINQQQQEIATAEINRLTELNQKLQEQVDDSSEVMQDIIDVDSILEEGRIKGINEVKEAIMSGQYNDLFPQPEPVEIIVEKLNTVYEDRPETLKENQELKNKLEGTHQRVQQQEALIKKLDDDIKSLNQEVEDAYEQSHQYRQFYRDAVEMNKAGEITKEELRKAKAESDEQFEELLRLQEEADEKQQALDEQEEIIEHMQEVEQELIDTAVSQIYAAGEQSDVMKEEHARESKQAKEKLREQEEEIYQQANIIKRQQEQMQRYQKALYREQQKNPEEDLAQILVRVVARNAKQKPILLQKPEEMKRAQNTILANIPPALPESTRHNLYTFAHNSEAMKKIADVKPLFYAQRLINQDRERYSNRQNLTQNLGSFIGSLPRDYKDPKVFASWYTEYMHEPEYWGTMNHVIGKEGLDMGYNVEDLLSKVGQTKPMMDNLDVIAKEIAAAKANLAFVRETIAKSRNIDVNTIPDIEPDYLVNAQTIMGNTETVNKKPREKLSEELPSMDLISSLFDNPKAVFASGSMEYFPQSGSKKRKAIGNPFGELDITTQQKKSRREQGVHENTPQESFTTFIDPVKVKEVGSFAPQKRKKKVKFGK